MARSRDKTSATLPATKASGRGKNRFESSSKAGRTTAVVLPARPPRQVDSEIVSILLGADPSTLLQTQETQTLLRLAQEEDSAKHSVYDEHLTEQSETDPEQDDKAVALTPSNRISANSPELLESVGQVPTSLSSVPNFDLQSPSTAVSHSLPLSGGDPSLNIQPPPLINSSPFVFAETGITPEHQTSSLPSTIVETPTFPGISSFEEFTVRWKHGLRKGQLKICEILWNKTHALGLSFCVTSFSELSRLSGLQIRQCFNIIAQLEALKFVEREKHPSTPNKKDQGSVIYFHPLTK